MNVTFFERSPIGTLRQFGKVSETPQNSVGQAFGEGLVTGGKAAVNGTVKAAVSTATLGLVEAGDTITVTEEDRAAGYGYSGGAIQFIGETGLGFATGGMSTSVQCTSKAARATAMAARAFDVAGNVVNVGKAAVDISQNGLTVQNTIQLAGGAVSVAGDLKGIGKGCFVAGTPVVVSGLPEDGHSSAPESVFKASQVAGVDEFGTTTMTALRTVAIEALPLGARVPTVNPRSWEYDESLPEPNETDWVHITMTTHRQDGSIVDIEMLRPRSVIDSNQFVPGATLPMVNPELQVAGTATVETVRPCPSITTGPGSVVISRFVTRQVDTIVKLELEGGEVLEGTPIHPVWSLDRMEWVPLGELKEGERLNGEFGPIAVRSVDVQPCIIPVYNLEIHGEHVYQVTRLGILVHNSGCGEQTRNALGQFESKTPGQLMPGQSSVNTFIEDVQSKGVKVVGTNISVNTPFGRRTFDVGIENAVTGNVIGVEIKSSDRALKRFDPAARQQTAADRFLRAQGGFPAVGQYEDLIVDDAIKLVW